MQNGFAFEDLSLRKFNHNAAPFSKQCKRLDKIKTYVWRHHVMDHKIWATLTSIRDCYLDTEIKLQWCFFIILVRNHFPRQLLLKSYILPTLSWYLNYLKVIFFYSQKYFQYLKKTTEQISKKNYKKAWQKIDFNCLVIIVTVMILKTWVFTREDTKIFNYYWQNMELFFITLEFHSESFDKRNHLSFWFFFLIQYIFHQCLQREIHGVWNISGYFYLVCLVL